MPEQVNTLAQSAATDEQEREKLIHMQEQMILTSASAACHRYISKSDDEWSVALCAFSKAVDTYNAERGDFLPYARLLIQRNLTDYYRKNSPDQVHTVSLDEVYGDPDDEDGAIDVPDPKSDPTKNTLKDEIMDANAMLADYGFRFFDLTECSPQQDRTREQCADVIRTALDSPIILSELKSTRKLPVKALSQHSGISRKIIDRYRKYIIMAILILNGDYPQIAEYLKFVGKEKTT